MGEWSGPCRVHGAATGKCEKEKSLGQPTGGKASHARPSGLAPEHCGYSLEITNWGDVTEEAK